MEQTVLNVLPPLSLPDAVSICTHFQYLIDSYYDVDNPSLGKIDALIIHSYNKREEVISEYKAKRLNHGKIYRTPRHRIEEYDILLVLCLNHPQLKTQFEIFKDLRSYVIEQSIDFPFPKLL